MKFAELRTLHDDLVELHKLLDRIEANLDEHDGPARPNLTLVREEADGA